MPESDWEDYEVSDDIGGELGGVSVPAGNPVQVNACPREYVHRRWRW